VTYVKYLLLLYKISVLNKNKNMSKNVMNSAHNSPKNQKCVNSILFIYNTYILLIYT